MINYKKTFLLALIFFPVFAFSSIKVTFINPGKDTLPEGAFWISVSDFMQAAANDLNIDLEILYSQRDHIKMVNQAKMVAQRPIGERPDYLVIVNEKLRALPMLELAKQSDIKTIVIMNDIIGEDLTQSGGPRASSYPNWIGSLIPNNQYAGYVMAKQLIEETLKNHESSERISVAAIAGDHQTPASVDRNEGFLKALKEYENVDFTQMVYAQWERETARNFAKGLMKRYPGLDAVWSANDNIAFGAMDAAIEAGMKPGKDIYYVGCNWWNQAVDAVIDGRMVSTVGGHFMSGGWSLVMLYDYHNGIDFSSEGLQIQKNMFSAIDSSNAESYKRLFGDGDWNKIDFKQFSKFHNFKVTTYEFDLQSILRQF